MSKRKITLAPIAMAAPKRKTPVAPKQAAAKSRVFYDVLSPKGAPDIIRIRLTTPITPMAVRAQLVDASADIPEENRQAYIRNRLTKLDRRLTDEGAAALEEYATAENELGRVKTGSSSWDAVVVDTSGSGKPVNPHDGRLGILARTAMVKKSLSDRDKHALELFCAQMRGERGAEDGQCAHALGYRGRTFQELEGKWIAHMAGLGEHLAKLFKMAGQERKARRHPHAAPPAAPANSRGEPAETACRQN